MSRVPTIQAEYDDVDAKVSAFLGELSDLCKRYGIGISGCGCCGSPTLEVDGCGDRDYEYLGCDQDYDYTVNRSDIYTDMGEWEESFGERKPVKTRIVGFTIGRNGVWER